ncbi:Txe/YoeB family addiction module toxin [Adlercreutzia sp. ZJ242]|uniref:Txe/YoeB family addiction module toxin n=1 Tax=Adlercreutzia sp. ZJ242 TaxID=2709409 RepID=UPI0013EB474D|nr:Txe/YoeB family addiction module toxin [Adlercreutzia sp. ZJ242]
MRKVWSESAWDDYVWWQSQDRKTLKRINKLVKDIERSASDPGSAPVGKAERLKHSRFGLSSVRIDDANRLVYKVEDGMLLIVSCKGHYQ